MNIRGLANFNGILDISRANDKSGKDQINSHGISFIDSFRMVAQSANIRVADGASSAMLSLNRNKEEKLEELFSFTETEEKILDESLARIKKLLKELSK